MKTEKKSILTQRCAHRLFDGNKIPVLLLPHSVANKTGLGKVEQYQGDILEAMKEIQLELNQMKNE